MTEKATNWLLVLAYFLHALATVVWLGGLALLLIVVWPAARDRLAAQLPDGALLTFFDTLRRRFTPLANLSLIVLLGTGLLQMELNPHYTGLLQINDDWGRAILGKHVLIVAMIVISVIMQGRVVPALERATLLARHARSVSGAEAEKATLIQENIQRRERQLAALTLILGLVVLLLTAVALAA